MAFDRRLRAAAAQAGVLALGSAAALAAVHGLYATTLAAVLAGAWLAAGSRGLQGAPTPRAAAPAPMRGYGAAALRALLNEAPAPLLLLEPGAAPRALNRAGRALFATDDRLVHPPAELMRALREAPATARPQLSLTAPGDDRPRSYALSLADIASDEGPLRLAVLLDVHADLQAAEAATLRRTLEVLGHELMNALTPVGSLAESATELLAEGAPPAAVAAAREAAATIARRAGGLAAFVAGYRAAADLPPPRPRVVDVAQLAQDVVRLARARPDAAGVRLDLHLPAEPGLRLTDPDLLAQALTNVVANAVEATRSRPDARVSVTLAQGGAGWRLLVTDNGPGVPLSDVEAIFVPMVTTKSGGSGLGLHVSRSALRSLGGELTFAPASGDGLTTFQLAF